MRAKAEAIHINCSKIRIHKIEEVQLVDMVLPKASKVPKIISSITKI